MFVTISVILLGAIYSSISLIAFGAISCVAAGNGVDQICSTTEAGKTKKVEYCYVDDKGNPVCITVYQSKTGPALVTDLRNALENTELQTAIEDTQNTTNVPKGLLGDGRVLSNEGIADDNEDEDSPDFGTGNDNEE